MLVLKEDSLGRAYAEADLRDIAAYITDVLAK